MPAGGIAYFELQCRPDLSLATLVRRFVGELYLRSMIAPERTSRIALATHELLEHAARYSKDGETTIRIAVDLDQQPGRSRSR
jgi:anti-sigma regulatory factor (Ser/Thr protein kinase)